MAGQSDATEQALQALPDAIVLVDDRGRIRFVNVAAQEMTGYAAEELVSFPVEVLVPESKRRSHTGWRARYQESPSSRQMGTLRDLQLRRKDGTVIPVDVGLNPLPGDDDPLIAATVHDRSSEERRSLEDLLLAEIGRIVNSERDINKIYRLVSDSIQVLVPYDRLVVSMNTNMPGVVERVFVMGVQVPGVGVGIRSDVAAGTPAAERSFVGSTSDDSPVVGAPPSVDTAFIGLQSWVEVPLGDSDNPIGYLGLRSIHENAYSDSDAGLLERVAAQISPAIENGRLLAAAEEESRERSALVEIGKIISSSTELADVWDQSATRISEILPSVKVVVLTVDSDSGTFSHHQDWGLRTPETESFAETPFEGTMTGEVVKTRAPILIDCASPLKELQRRFPITDLDLAHAQRVKILVAPMIHRNEVVGAIHLWRDGEIETDERHVELAERIAGQIAGSIASSLLVSRLQEDARVKDALGEIGRILSSTQNIPSVFDDCTAVIQGLIPFDRFAIVLFDEITGTKTDLHVAGLPVPNAPDREITPIVGSVAENVIGGGSPVIWSAEDIVNNPNRIRVIDSRLDLGLKSLLAVPLIWEDRPVGMLDFWSKEDEAYGEADVDLAVRVATQVAPPLATWQYMGITQRQAEEQSILAEIGRIVGSSLRLEDVYQRFASQVSKLIPFDRISYLALEDSREYLVLQFVAGTNIPDLGIGANIPIKGSLGEQSMSARDTRVISLAELAKDDRVQLSEQLDALRHHEIKEILSIPLISDGQPIGVIHVGSTHEGTYTEDHRLLGNRIGAQIAGAFANALTYQQVMLAERARADAEAAQLELVKLDDDRSQFLSTISHELRTPLTSLLAFLDIFSRNRDNNLTPRQGQQIDVMQRSGRRLEVLINDLLDVSRLGAGTFTLEITEFDFKEVQKEVQLSLEPILRLKKQKLNVHQPARGIWLLADRDRVIQIISNLVSNASKYSDEGTNINLKSSVDEGNLKVTVRDSGIGISEEDQASLFTPFFRANNAETQAEAGSGLGLTIVKAIVELHGGNVSIESEYGVGTTVAISLSDCREGPSAAHLAAQGHAEKSKSTRSRLSPEDDTASDE